MERSSNSNGEIANAYGVQFIPKGYLLDSKGCVIQKDLRYENLQEVLVARYGDDPILHESEDEAESSPTDSGDDDVGGGQVELRQELAWAVFGLHASCVGVGYAVFSYFLAQLSLTRRRF